MIDEKKLVGWLEKEKEDLDHIRFGLLDTKFDIEYANIDGKYCAIRKVINHIKELTNETD